MWPKFMAQWLGTAADHRTSPRRRQLRHAARHLGLSVLVTLPMVVANDVAAREIADCPQTVATPSDVQPRIMSLRDILRLPNRPNPGVEGGSVTTAGYLIRAKAIKPAAACPTLAEPATRIWLATRKPTTLKGRISRHRAFVVVVPTALLEARLGQGQTLKDLIDKRVRVVGVLVFNPARQSALMRTRGSLWELGAVSDLAPCSGGSCLAPAAPPAAHPVSRAAEGAKR